MRLRALVAVGILLSSSLIAHADTLAQDLVGPQTSDALPGYAGQSFTVLGAGSYDDLIFTFHEDYIHPVAQGTAYLLSQPYFGTPDDLTSATPGFLGSANAIGRIYTFLPTVSVTAGDVYFIYIPNDPTADQVFPLGLPYSGGSGWNATTDSSDFTPEAYSFDFYFQGAAIPGSIAPTPEPSSLALLATGLLGVSILARRHLLSAAA